MGTGQAEKPGLRWLKFGILGIWGLVLGYVIFTGITTQPAEGDSLAYHLPIAKLVREGRWLDRTAYKKPFDYYPGMGETLLAGMQSVGLPENLFNVIGWLALFVTVRGLGRRAGLGKEAATIAAVGVGMWPAVVRLLNNQTVDVWLAVWWTASVILWEKNKEKTTDWVWLGIMMGMMVGTKVSGCLYAAGLLAVYSGQLRFGSSRQAGLWLGLAGVGGWWYAKNWMLTGNPFFPAGVMGFAGDANFRLMDWSPLKTLLFYPGGWGQFLSALMSEYLVWAGLFLLPIWIRNRWVLLGWINFGIYLLLPSWPQNLVSDLRYLFVAFIPWTVAVWRWAEKKGYASELAVTALILAAAEMTQLDFRPKLWCGFIAGGMLIWMWRRKRGWQP